VSNKNKKGLPSLTNQNHGTPSGKSSIKDRAYIEGKNSASHALRTIIRNFYSNRPYDDKTICRGVVTKNKYTKQDDQGYWDSFWSWLNPKENESFHRYKVRVIDDPRHFFLPVPSKSKSIENEFYPWFADFRTAGGEEKLKIGSIVEVQFIDVAAQWGFISNLSTGVITGVIDSATHDRPLDELFSNCIAPRPTKGGKQKTTVGKVCQGVAFAPGRIWKNPPIPPSGTDKNKIKHPSLPVEPGGQFLKSFMDRTTGMLDPNQIVAALKTYNMYVTSPVGMRSGGPHKGVDFRAPMDAPIYAVFDGTVERVRFNREGFGWYIMIKHDQFDGPDFYTLYAHLKEPDANIWKAGKKVAQGKQIGTSGATGKTKPPNRTGAHLHFEVVYDTQFQPTTEALDPEAFFINSGFVKS